MALKACRECGKDVSTEAKTCPHCGVRDPSGAIAAGQRAARQGCLLVIMVFTVIFGAAAYFGSGTNKSSPTDQRTPVMIGHRGKFVANSIGCPTLKEFSRLVSDQAAHDKVGFQRHFVEYACVAVPPGATGLNLDYSLLSGANKIRLDVDEQTYWMYTQDQEHGTWLFVPDTTNR
ncbi:MAG: hypothetical protein ACREFO_03905 [Acetobacteraceae bacterium]